MFSKSMIYQLSQNWFWSLEFRSKTTYVVTRSPLYEKFSTRLCSANIVYIQPGCYEYIFINRTYLCRIFFIDPVTSYKITKIINTSVYI